jgi:hypothetical protein
MSSDVNIDGVAGRDEAREGTGVEGGTRRTKGEPEITEASIA